MHYENNWASLNARPVPAWFEDAKFGIFAHWGIYSVPSFAARTEYAEWYGYNVLSKTENATTAFHNRIYGSRKQYADFVGDFHAELFDPDEWAEIFQRSGARYFNLTSKHHDGFCLFRSKYAWNWNSVDVGPHRDFCAELSEALSKTDVRFGVYHSVYEWFHPLYLENPERYAVEHLIPMLKELIETYHPATLFTDGEWDHPSSVWHSTDFLQWLYNDSSVRDFIVPNDRWGKETRGRLGGNFTTEYGIIDNGRTIDECEERVFEECRGMGHSFGLNRNERAEDYLSATELIWMLCDLVSKGGNLLLNVGPSAAGKIPPLMEERLLQMGRWLSVNGDAIYGTRKGPATTEEAVRYTKKGDNLYALIHAFPFGERTLEAIPFDPSLHAVLLSDPASAPIQTVNDNGKLKLCFPAYSPDVLQSSGIYAVRLAKNA